MGGHIATACVWRSENNLQKSVLSFSHVGRGDQTQVIRFSCKYLYPLSHVTSPSILDWFT